MQHLPLQINPPNTHELQHVMLQHKYRRAESPLRKQHIQQTGQHHINHAICEHVCLICRPVYADFGVSIAHSKRKWSCRIDSER